MKDATFQRHLNQLMSAKNRYLAELMVCEDEYERRFGANPSDASDDYWIDAFHAIGSNGSSPTVADISENALITRATNQNHP